MALNPNLNNILMTEASTLKQLGYLTEELDESRIPLSIKYVQDTKIQSVIGTPIYNLILTNIKNNSIESRFSILLDNYIVSSIGYFVESELQLPTSNKLRNKGVVNTSDDKVSGLDIQSIKYMNNYLNDRGEYYLNELSNYIQQNLSTYPEYFQHQTFDTMPDKSVFKCSIYLGEENFNKYTRPENP